MLSPNLQPRTNFHLRIEGKSFEYRSRYSPNSCLFNKHPSQLHPCNHKGSHITSLKWGGCPSQFFKAWGGAPLLFAIPTSVHDSDEFSIPTDTAG